MVQFIHPARVREGPTCGFKLYGSCGITGGFRLGHQDRKKRCVYRAMELAFFIFFILDDSTRWSVSWCLLFAAVWKAVPLGLTSRIPLCFTISTKFSIWPLGFEQPSR